MTIHKKPPLYAGSHALELKDASGNGQADTSGLSPELKKVIDDMMRGVSALREKVDANDREVKKIGGEIRDPVRKDEIDKITGTIDELKTAFAKDILDLKRRATGPGGQDISPERKAHSEAFEKWFRKGGGEQVEAQLLDLQTKAIAGISSVDPSGGFAVRPEMDTEIEQTVKDVSPIRQIARVVSVGTNAYQKLVNRHGVNSGWVGETNARPQTLAPDLTRVDFPTMELYAMPAASQTLLDDATINVDQWIAEEVSLEFAQKEGQAFIAGQGGTQPLGIIGGYNIVADTSFTWGNIGYVPSGAAGAFTAVAPADALLNLMFALRAPYRVNASFVLGRQTMGTVRRIKDGQGNYLADLRMRDNYLVETIFGRPAVEAEDMPNIAANSHSIAYGDFKRGYVIVDRAGIRVLRDPYTAKPYVLFYTTKRVGGGVQNFEAIKLMRFAVS